MKTVRFLIIFLMSLGFFSVSAEAQKKKPAKKPVPKPVVTTTASFGDVKTAKEKVSNQIKNITTFVSKLPPFVQSIEAIDRESKTRKLQQSSIDLNNKMKRDLIQAMRNFRAGLTALETDFRTKPALRKYLLKIEGIAGYSAQSEDLAMAGRFSEAGQPLTSAAGKLTDTLAVMP
ncbi:MAG: hypothetical protein H7070_11500 [Saprospiraceae bacterium]|nr:hypothetical protein [Pyrinomonadaceae bacterium]